MTPEQITLNEPRKIIFRHGRAIGDALMMSSGIRDFKLLFPEISINVDNNFPALWQNNPYIDQTIKKSDPGVEYYNVGYPIINNANNSYTHFTFGFLLNMIATVDAFQPLPISIGDFCAAFSNGEIGDFDKGDASKEELQRAPEIYKKLKQKYGTGKKDGGLFHLPDHLKDLYTNSEKFCRIFARQRADIHLTEKERTYSLVKDLYGEDMKYWVVSPGGKSDCTCKIWDWRKFQKVIDYFDGMLKFVVIGRSDHIVEKLKNVIDLVDKFNDDVRGLIPLVYHAEGCVTGVSFLLHLAAAVPSRFNAERKPCVVIYGGREPTSFTGYCNHQILHGNGSMSCASNGGCWKSRIIELNTSPSRNTRLCERPVKVDGRTIPSCMDSITSEDVIRAIEKYYDGDLYTYMNPITSRKKAVKLVEDLPDVPRPQKVITSDGKKEINLLASLQSKGGGEQSSLMIAKVLRDDGWEVNFFPWDSVHQNYVEEKVNKWTFKSGMLEHMKENIPLLFYANDQIGTFLDIGQEIVEKSSMLIVGINYINAGLPKCRWLDKTEKLKAVIFQNTERKNDFVEKQIGFEDLKLIILFGAINLDELYEVCPKKRERKDEPFRVMRHGLPDNRKYVTESTKSGGDKKHLWQRSFDKETSVRFYQRLLKDLPKNVVFEFMEAHSELVNAYPNEPRMIFRKFDSMPVPEFLSHGHCYLMRSSSHWRDNFPRVHAEGMAAGLISIVEPRDGTAQRIKDNVGDIGLFAVHYDEFLLHLRTLNRKRDYCYAAGNAAKQWAKRNLDPKAWCDVLEELCFNA